MSSSPSGLTVVSATRDAQGGYLEEVLAKLAQSEREVEQYRRAWEEAEAEIDRMAHQLQRAYDQGFVIDEAPPAPGAAPADMAPNIPDGAPPAPVCDAAGMPSTIAGPDATGPDGRSWWRKLSCVIVSLRFCCRN